MGINAFPGSNRNTGSGGEKPSISELERLAAELRARTEQIQPNVSEEVIEEGSTPSWVSESGIKEALDQITRRQKEA